MFMKNTSKETDSIRIVVLENVRSAHNVGSVFRTADAAGVSQIHLLGYTPRPLDRFGRPVPELVKTALGAHEYLPWSGSDDGVALVRSLQAQGVLVVAVEQSEAAVPLPAFKPPVLQSVAYIFGNERDGVSPELCQQADQVIEIPMYGQKESLNISVSVGVVLFHTHPDWR